MLALDIKPLTPDLAADYFDFHENRAFTDHPEWSHCYCFWFHMSSSQHQEMAAEIKAAGNSQAALHSSLKTRAKKYINGGILRGYVAYTDGLLVGWCNANDKTAYRRFDYHETVDEFIKTTGTENVMAVTCFCIAPQYRSQNVATALLQRVIVEAKEAGYSAVEGYVRKKDKPDPFDYTGPMRLYAKAGFTAVARWQNLVVMRKTLAGPLQGTK